MWLLNYAEAPKSAERENRSERANGGVCVCVGGGVIGTWGTLCSGGYLGKTAEILKAED